MLHSSWPSGRSNCWDSPPYCCNSNRRHLEDEFPAVVLSQSLCESFLPRYICLNGTNETSYKHCCHSVIQNVTLWLLRENSSLCLCGIIITRWTVSIGSSWGKIVSYFPQIPSWMRLRHGFNNSFGPYFFLLFFFFCQIPRCIKSHLEMDHPRKIAFHADAAWKNLSLEIELLYMKWPWKHCITPELWKP